MTPADELRAAAEKIRKLTGALPANEWGDRPWQAEECANTEFALAAPCPCIVSQGEYRAFDQPQDPPIQYVADAETPDHAAYIAAMHPGVATALAKWLWSWVGIDFREDAALPEDAQHALAIARAMNGTGQ